VHKNPNIVDLSDKNRPTKLAEVFGEIYDNEWTDAFEFFDGEPKTSSKSGEETHDSVDKLLNILKVIVSLLRVMYTVHMIQCCLMKCGSVLPVKSLQ